MGCSHHPLHHKVKHHQQKGKTVQTFINILEIIAFILKAILCVSAIVLSAMVGTYVHDELKETRLSRTTKLAKTSVKKYSPRHSYDPSKPQYRYEAGLASNSYLEWADKVTRSQSLPFGNEEFFSALLKEKETLQPIW